MMKERVSAMIFAAGLGTRLYPLTADKPKALVAYQGRPLLDYVMRKILATGIRHIVVNVHHFPDLIIQYINAQHYDARIDISDERELLRDTGGGLKFAEHLLQDSEHILLHNVDILSDIDLMALMESHLASDALATLAVRQRETSRYFLFDDEMNLRGWRNRKTGEEICACPAVALRPYAFSGIHIIRKELIEFIPSADKQSITPVYVELSKTHTLRGFLHNEGHWKDMGKSEAFAE